MKNVAQVYIYELNHRVCIPWQDVFSPKSVHYEVILQMLNYATTPSNRTTK